MLIRKFSKRFTSGILLFMLLLQSMTAANAAVLTDDSVSNESGENGDYEYFVLYDDTVRITRYNGSSSDVTVPDLLDGYIVSRIGQYAFCGVDTLQRVTIPDNITEIGDHSFYGCQNLKEITLSDNLKYIGYDAFDDTSYYKNEENWKNNCLYIGSHLIRAKDSIIGVVTLNENTLTIAEEAFSGCEQLISVNVPEKVESIGEGAFDNCSSLREILVDDNNLYFYDVNGVLFAKNYEYKELCEFLDNTGWSSRYKTGTVLISYPMGKDEKIYFVPREVQAICDYAFCECKLESVIFSEGLECIGEYAFAQSKQLVSVSFPSSLNSIGNDSFYGCSSLNNFFTSDQKRRLDEFAYVWVSDLILAEIIDYSEFNLKREAEELVRQKVFSKLGIDSRMLTKGESLEGSVNLLATTKDGTEVLINYTADLSNFKFWFGTKPYGVTGQLKLSIFKLSDGTQMGMTETIIVNYADLDTFVTNLQDIAKSTIFNIGKDVYGLSASKTADKAASAITDGLMTKALNSKSNYFSVVSRLTPKQKSVIQKALARVLTDKIKDCNQTVFKLLTTPSNAAKIHSFECPVNVKVYDNDGNLCAAIVNNQVDKLFSEVFATVNGDKKEFYLIGDDYYFVITGYDSGTMNYTVREFDNNGEIRKLTYEDVPISNGCIYYSLSPGTENMSNSYFDLLNKDGKVTYPTNGKDDNIIDSNNTYISRSGQCGSNVYYTLYEDGLLDIYGIGDMFEDMSNGSINYQHWGENITEVNIETGVSSIGKAAFSGCKNISSITIPETVKIIGNVAFANCESLRSITIPDNVTHVGEYAFLGCRNLTNVKISKNITNISDYMFLGCWNLSDITIPDNATSIGKGAFYGIGLVDLKIGNSVTIIGESAFKNCTELKEVTIPDSVTIIEGSAFESCKSLTNITIGKNVTSIEDYAFAWCEQLANVDIPDNVTSMGCGVFAGCMNLSRVYIGTGVNLIGNRMFYNCLNLTYIELPNSVTNIGASAFQGCGIESAIIPNSVTNIGASAFQGCGIKSVIIPNSVTNIEDSAFEFCNSLEIVEISDSVTNIGRNAFCSCKSLTSITIGKNVKNIGANAFTWCEQLSNVEIPSSVISIGGAAFLGCKGLSKVKIDKGVTNIESNAFCNCESIKCIVIPDSVTSIGESAFQGCGIKSVTIPRSVTHIGKYAFGYERSYSRNGITIYGNINTVAEEYSNENGFTFVALDANASTGDFDGNGVVDSKDRIELTRYLAKWSGYENIYVSAADVNNDSKVNAKDRIILTRHLAKWQGYETLPYRLTN